MASRQQAAAQSQTATEVAKPAPRPALAQLLAAFLEEKNIRWGELIGGLLIVSCSIALVLSFWAEIADRPFLKFFVFNGTLRRSELPGVVEAPTPHPPPPLSHLQDGRRHSTLRLTFLGGRHP